jgi:hypothetical protein
MIGYDYQHGCHRRHYFGIIEPVGDMMRGYACQYGRECPELKRVVVGG